MRRETTVEMPSTFSAKKAHAAQLKLSEKVVDRNMLPEKIRYIAGVDVAYTEESSIGAVAVLDYESLSLKESKTAICKTLFPYIPTLLSYREVPPAFSAIKKLELDPDIFLVDGQGIMHPYRLGFASHLGLIVAKPTIGVAKSRLCGEVQTSTKDGWAPIVDKEEIVGAAVTTKKGRNPVYVSIGNMISLKTAIAIVRRSARTYAIPEPTRQAHIIATQEKRKIQNTPSRKGNR
ncbi:MAG TPA: endonuclease V [Candidatus Bathyarchaeia archaeon]|nr:endonuclease V [Candidatus Bathyarchaeia archaeon]